LFVVATPIGNLDDLSTRGVETLSRVDVILAEDTRIASKLLARCGISTKLRAYHDHNERKSVAGIIEELLQGRSAALISDAGTPLLSDPGYHLVKAAHEAGITVSPIPGPSSVTAALSVAGLSGSRFIFEGYPPTRGPARRQVFSSLRSERRTLLFLEVPHRIEASLKDMCEVFGPERPACLMKELTKIHETVSLAPLGELLRWMQLHEDKRKGEFIVAISGAESEALNALQAKDTLRILLRYLSVKDAAAAAAELTGARKRDLYQLALTMAEPRDG